MKGSKVVKCRTQACIECQKQIVRKIMATIPKEYRFDYEEVKKRAKPFVQKKEWKLWLYEEIK